MWVLRSQWLFSQLGSYVESCSHCNIGWSQAISLTLVPLTNEHRGHRVLGSSKRFLDAQWPKINSESNDNVHVVFLAAGSSPHCGYGSESMCSFSVCVFKPYNISEYFLQHPTWILGKHRLGTVVLSAQICFLLLCTHDGSVTYSYSHPQHGST